jgi:hypothetical protein
MRKERLKTIQVLLEFKVPTGVDFAEIRNCIITNLETFGGNRPPEDLLFDSLRDVRVSKPITPWRDLEKKPKLRVVK